MFAEQAVDTAHAAAVAEAAGEFSAEQGAGQRSTAGTELVDDGVDVGVRELGRARHGGIITENNGKVAAEVVGEDQEGCGKAWLLASTH